MIGIALDACNSIAGAAACVDGSSCWDEVMRHEVRQAKGEKPDYAAPHKKDRTNETD